MSVVQLLGGLRVEIIHPLGYVLEIRNKHTLKLNISLLWGG